MQREKNNTKGTHFTYDYGDRYTYEYGANGQVSMLTDNELLRISRSEYDTANRPMRITHIAQDTGDHLYTGEVEYDEYNNLKTFKEQVGTARTPYQTDFTYDNENKPTLITFGDTNNKVAYAYDAIGRVSSRTVTAAGHAFATAYGYAAGNNGSGNTTTLISSLTQTGENFTYTYDDVGNIASVVQNNKTTAYTYDALGQLIRVDDENDTTSGTAGTTWTYEYDRGGNILEKKRYAYTTGTLGTALETVTYTYDTTWKDKLINYNGITIEYDAIGNPTKAGTKTGEVWDPDTWHYTWARGRQLQVMYKGSFGQPGYDEIAFTYNPEGLRTRKTRMYYSNGDVAYSSTEYTLHGKNLVHMTQGSDSLHFFYDAQNRPAVVNFNGTKYGYIVNLQGDVLGLIDSTGAEVVKYTYDAWGKVLSTTGSLASTLGTVQPFRYRGYVYDVETGRYYLRARYYNPLWFRFICSDSTDDLFCNQASLYEKNLYTYCDNNPIVREDISGQIWGWLIGAAIGALAGVVGQVVSDVATSIMNGEVTISNWETYVGAAVGGAAAGIVIATSGDVNAANIVSGSVTTGVSLMLEKFAGDSDKTWVEIAINTVADGAISYGLGKLPGIEGITKGRNSYNAVYKSGLTKLRNGTASRMSFKVMRKGIVATVVSGVGLDIYYGVKQFSYDKVKDLIME